jgi:RNA polymerase sigma-70 factor (ECF subfamily)
MSAPAPSADDMKQWLKAVAEQQDRDAFGRLFQYFAPRIASFMERSGLSAAEAEEISQETMIALWKKAALYDPAQAGVSTWVFTVARNLRVDLARKASRASAFVAALQELPMPLEASVEDVALARERDGRMRKAMATLSPEQATVLRLSFFAEKPHAEIAKELSLPLGTVKSRTRLAMAKIRAILERDL